MKKNNASNLVVGARVKILGIAILFMLVTLVIGLGLPVDAAGSNGITLIQSDTNHVILEFQASAYTAQDRRVDTGTYTELSIPGAGETGEVGKPKLPMQGTMIGVPPGATLTMNILADETRVDALARPPLPVPTEQVDYLSNPNQPRVLGFTFAASTLTSIYPAVSSQIAGTDDWRSQHFALVRFYPLQYNPATRQLIFHRRIRVEITFSYPRGRTPQTLGAAVKESSEFESALRDSLLNYDSAKTWRMTTLAAPQRSRLPATSTPLYRINLTAPGDNPTGADGIYRLTCLMLNNAGIPMPLDLTQVQIATAPVISSTTEIAVKRTGTCASSGDTGALEFYATVPFFKYTNTNVYWLTYGVATGKAMALRDGTGTGTLAAFFTDTVHIERHYIRESFIPNMTGEIHWFMDAVPLGGQTRYYPFTLNRFNPSANVSGTLTLAVAGSTKIGPNHHTQTFMSGSLVNDVSWSGDGYRTIAGTFPISLLSNGIVTATVFENGSAALSIGVESLDISYPSNFTAITDTLTFTQTNPNNWLYQIGNYTDPNIEVFDITDPMNQAAITLTAPIGSAPYTAQFADTNGSPARYIVLTRAQTKTPNSIVADTPINLLASTNSADYIILANKTITDTLTPLKNLRQAQGLNTMILDVQNVYDVFSNGVAEPQAIKDFLTYARANWKGVSGNVAAPYYLLLVGDATYDPKGYCAPGVSSPCYADITTNKTTYLPTFLKNVDPYISETGDDNYFVASDIWSLPNMAVGRLPVSSASEASIIVNKIVNYAQNPPAGNWRSQIDFVTDSYIHSNGTYDSAGDFWGFSDVVALNSTLVPPGLTANRIYYNACSDWVTYPYCVRTFPPYFTSNSVSTTLISDINNGRLIINYVGHGEQHAWGDDKLLSQQSATVNPAVYPNDLSLMTNGGKLPVFIDMTCYTGYFIQVNDRSIAEALIRLNGGGSLANWAATGLGIAYGHDYLNRAFFDSAVRRRMTIGAATVYGKQYLLANTTQYNDLLDTYVLLGDPTIRLQIPYWLYLPLIDR